MEKQTESFVSLFEQKRTGGFWPVIDTKSGKTKLTGKIEMEMELLNQTEAEKYPAGLGQEEPNVRPKLDKPKRPETSFLWITSPWKSLRHIIWRNYKWYFLIGILLLLLAIFLVLFVYSIPVKLFSYNVLSLSYLYFRVHR